MLKMTKIKNISFFCCLFVCFLIGWLVCLSPGKIETFYNFKIKLQIFFVLFCFVLIIELKLSTKHYLIPSHLQRISICLPLVAIFFFHSTNIMSWWLISILTTLMHIYVQFGNEKITKFIFSKHTHVICWSQRSHFLLYKRMGQRLVQ